MNDRPTHQGHDVRGKLASGAVWMVAMRAASRSVGVLSTLILARLLVPDDFGLVAVSASIIAMFEILGYLGFEQALIRNTNAERGHYDTVWTLRLLRGAVVGGIVWALAPLAATYFNEPRLADVLPWLGFAALLEGLANIGVVKFRKDLQFHLDFLYQMYIRLGSFVITIALAWIFRSYWALIVGTISARVLAIVLSFWMSPYRPRPTFSKWRELFGFGAWMMLAGLFSIMYESLGKMVLGKTASTQAVGVFHVSEMIATMPSKELVAPIKRATLPALSLLQYDMENFRTTYLELVSAIFLCITPFAVGIWILPDLLVLVALGDKWVSAIPVLQVAALFGFMEACRSQTRPALLALNRPDLVAVLAGVRLAGLLIGLLLLMPQGGAVGVAWAMVCGAGAGMVVDYIMLNRYLRIPIRAIFGIVWRPLIALACMALIVIHVRDALNWDGGASGSLGQLVLYSAIGAASYGLMLYVLWRFSGSPDSIEGKLVSLIGKGISKALRFRRGARIE